MDLRQAETFNAHWECPFDQQILWVEKWSDEPSLSDAGAGRDRLRLWDNQWCCMYDSAINPAPVYPYIGMWISATIDYADGTRWIGMFYRCPEGIRRETYPSNDYLKWMLHWPTVEAVS